MKTIFLSIYDGDTEKVILRSGVFELLKRSGNRIVLLIRGTDRLEYYRENFEKENVLVELLPFAFTRAEQWWYHLGWNTIPTFSVRLRRRTNYLKHRSRPRYFIEGIFGFLGRFRPWRSFLRMAYYTMPDNYAAELFDKHKPDLLFSPNMFSPEDFRLLRAAKKRGIRTVATAKSWDVLTTKAFTRIIADKLLVFNQYNRDEAIAIGDYPPERVIITGFPQFDVYHRKGILSSREEFLGSLGIDPKKKVILFAVPGTWKTSHTKDIIAGLEVALSRSALGETVHILARFHPKYPDTSETLKGLRFFTFDRPGTHFSEKREYSIDMGVVGTFAWTFTDRDILHLANSIYHSEIAIITESTLALDAANFGKPIITLGYDGKEKLDYWSSIINTYDKNHFKHVMKSGGVRLAKSEEELMELIEGYLQDPARDADGRKRLRETMLYREDGKSAERVAEAVLSLL